jgi:hypothetical protein
MRTATLALLSVGIAAAVFAGPVSAQDVASGACFRGRDMEEWKSPDPHTMYVSVNPDRTYKLTFNQPCTPLSYVDARITTKFHGPDSVCGPLDWDLRVGDRNGNHQACIVRSMSLMAPAEVAAIPGKYRP